MNARCAARSRSRMLHLLFIYRMIGITSSVIHEPISHTHPSTPPTTP